MNWNATFGQTELLFVLFFVGIYLLYLVRIYWIARRLKTKTRSSLLKIVLRSSYFALLIMALLNPSFGDVAGTIRAEGRELMLLIDVSKSMDASDIQPSRLEKVKYETKKLIDHFSSDRIGLIVFSEEAYLMSPLTFDRSSIDLFVPKISTKLLGHGGTDFNPPLELALKKLLKTKSNDKSKVIILISDGENFGNLDRNLLSQIRRNGINLFSVGVGTIKGATLKQGNGFKKDADGNVVVSKLESNNLRRIAIETNGAYVELSDVSASFAGLIEQVEQISANLIDQRQVNVTANKYMYFLFVALFLIGLDVFFTIRTFRL